MTIKSLFLFLPLVTLSLVASGCATRSEVAIVRTEAMEARRIADRALTIAEEANRRSERTEEMLDRSFRHTMRK